MEYDEVAEQVDERDDAPFPEAEEDDVAVADEASDVAQELNNISARMTDEELSEEEIASHVEQVEALARSFPQIVNDMPEYKNFLNTVAKVRDEQADADDDDDDEEVVEGKNAKTTKIQEENQEEASGDVFGITKQKKIEPIEFEVGKEFVNHIKENYAIEDPDTFFNSVNKWRNDSQNYSSVSQERDDLLSGIGALPQPIKDSIVAFTNAQDYHQAFVNSGGRLNYELSFDEQNKESIVKHYFAEKSDKLQSRLDDGEIDEHDYEERIDDLYDSAKRLYKTDQQSFEKQRADFQREQEELLKEKHSSALGSVDNLREAYPDFSKADLQRVRQRLVNGDIESLFIDENGAYTQDAATMLAFAMYGKEVVSKLLEQAELKGESEANKKIVKRGDKSIKTRTSAEKASQKEQLDAIGHLQQEFKPDPYA